MLTGDLDTKGGIVIMRYCYFNDIVKMAFAQTLACTQSTTPMAMSRSCAMAKT
jgi:hypothetical protein